MAKYYTPNEYRRRSNRNPDRNWALLGPALIKAYLQGRGIYLRGEQLKLAQQNQLEDRQRQLDNDAWRRQESERDNARAERFHADMMSRQAATDERMATPDSMRLYNYMISTGQWTPEQGKQYINKLSRPDTKEVDPEVEDLKAEKRKQQKADNIALKWASSIDKAPEEVKQNMAELEKFDPESYNLAMFKFKSLTKGSSDKTASDFAKSADKISRKGANQIALKLKDERTARDVNKVNTQPPPGQYAPPTERDNYNKTLNRVNQGKEQVIPSFIRATAQADKAADMASGNQSRSLSRSGLGFPELGAYGDNATALERYTDMYNDEYVGFNLPEPTPVPTQIKATPTPITEGISVPVLNPYQALFYNNYPVSK